uniref:Ig-like domain-containing protein n=1 Tax=Fundulus heteroclitus TaxID=8078 RepID=A0A3Q2Q7X9_FUNHE
ENYKYTLLCIPRTRTKQGEAAFSSYAPLIWNKLPENCIIAESLSSFKSRLKTHLFRIAFNCSRYAEQCVFIIFYSGPAASLSVSSGREQHFTSESVTLKCGGNSTQSINGATWGPMTGSSCTFKPSYLTVVYWCESISGEFSNAVNITAHVELLLVSPVHPVAEGAFVTLSCRLRGQNTLSNVFFYHNDKLVQNDSRGELKISAAICLPMNSEHTHGTKSLRGLLKGR